MSGGSQLMATFASEILASHQGPQLMAIFVREILASRQGVPADGHIRIRDPGLASRCPS